MAVVTERLVGFQTASSVQSIPVTFPPCVSAAGSLRPCEVPRVHTVAVRTVKVSFRGDIRYADDLRLVGIGADNRMSVLEGALENAIAVLGRVVDAHLRKLAPSLLSVSGSRL